MVNFPTSLDNFTNPAGSDGTAALNHAKIHVDANDAIRALEKKVGADGSTDQDSHDFKLSEVTGPNKAESTEHKGQPNGYAPLNLSGKIDPAYLGSSIPSSDPITQGDAVAPGTGGTTTYDSANNKIVTTYGDGSKVEYRTDGIYTIDASGNITSFSARTGTFNSGLQRMEYTNGDYVDVANGYFYMNGGEIAYKNKPNSFSEANVFSGDANFKGRVVTTFFKPSAFTGGTFVFDGKSGMSQSLAFSGTTAMVLNAKNMSQGVYQLAIVKSGGTAAFSLPAGGSKATCGCSMTDALPDTSDANTLNAFYKITAASIPTSLDNGVHIFVLSVFETGCHVAYAGKSTMAA